MTEPGPESAATPPNDQPAAPHSRLTGLFSQLRSVSQGAVRAALARLIEGPREPDAPVENADEAAAVPPQESRRIRVLHTVTEQLRGAADNYVAAKLDELEARVDVKLDQIEERIDRKITELDQQLSQMRDRELRHRLRVLKLTLVFTVFVAVISLVYKWVELLWLQPHG